MRNILTSILLLTPLLFFGQERTVSKLGVETIKYGKFVKSYIDSYGRENMRSDGSSFVRNSIAEYVYDGNPFNDNEKALKIYLEYPMD